MFEYKHYQLFNPATGQRNPPLHTVTITIITLQILIIKIWMRHHFTAKWTLYHNKIILSLLCQMNRDSIVRVAQSNYPNDHLYCFWPSNMKMFLYCMCWNTCNFYLFTCIPWWLYGFGYQMLLLIRVTQKTNAHTNKQQHFLLTPINNNICCCICFQATQD